MRKASALIIVCVSFLLAVTHAAGNSLAVDALGGSWMVSVLLQDQRPIPPTHVASVSSEEIVITPLPTSRVRTVLSALAGKLKLINVRVPGGGGRCRLPTEINLSFEVLIERDFLRVACNGGLLSSASLSRLLKENFTSETYSTPPQLAYHDGSSCVTLPWYVLSASAHVLGRSKGVISFELRDGSGARCRAIFEANRQTSSTQDDSSPSFYGPAIMLVAVIAMRMLPRYYLTKVGSIDKETYRCGTRGSVAQRRRADLLRQQDELVKRMKEQDGFIDKK